MTTKTMETVYLNLSSININPHLQLGRGKTSPQKHGIISIYLDPFAKTSAGKLIDIYQECHVEISITGAMSDHEKSWVEHQTRESWHKSFDFKMLSGYGIPLWRSKIAHFEYALAPDDIQRKILEISSIWHEVFTLCGNTYKTLSWGIGSMDLGLDLDYSLFEKFPFK